MVSSELTKGYGSLQDWGKTPVRFNLCKQSPVGNRKIGVATVLGWVLIGYRDKVDTDEHPRASKLNSEQLSVQTWVVCDRFGDRLCTHGFLFLPKTQGGAAGCPAC